MYIEENRRGIFPGPEESETDYCLRIKQLTPLVGNLFGKFPAPLSSLDRLEPLFSARPDWVKVDYKKKGFMPWEGASTQWSEEGFPLIEIYSSFLLKFYPEEEIIAHEIVHAMRMAFHEERFEEILAYRTSKNRFRRFFGPLFSRPSEVKAFLVLLLSSWILYLIELFNEGLGIASLLMLVPLGALLYLILRLCVRQRQLSCCLKNLSSLTDSPLSIALRLSDEEILYFARTPPESIARWVKDCASNSFRWRLLQFYFIPKLNQKLDLS